MLNSIRQPLLEEAASSPALLSDLAGLEQYIAESYDARSLIELLQNADDAGASRVAVLKSGQLLVVANDGREFTKTDFESLCRSAASSKVRGTTIGFRGIGFKSVVGLAKAVYLFSGRLEAAFSRTRTAQEIPQAARVPLLRIPHPVEPKDRARLAASVDALASSGFKTFFIFDDLVDNDFEAEVNAFDPTSLLFLRNVCQIELNCSLQTVVSVEREAIDGQTRSMHLNVSGSTTKWTVLDQNGVSVALVHDQTGVGRLDERHALVHAFMPSLETTGFAFKINGDFSTDPSRTRIILDESTGAGLNNVASIIVDLVAKCLNFPEAPAHAQLLAALVPVCDPRVTSFQRRCFKTELFAAIARLANGHFGGFLSRPPWLNSGDFAKIAAESGVTYVPARFDSVEGLPAFLKFLGVKEAGLKDLESGLTKVSPSLNGAADLVAHIAAQHATRQLRTSEINPGWRLWPITEVPLSIEEASRTGQPLSTQFMDLFSEKLGSTGELSRILSALSGPLSAANLAPNSETGASSFNETTIKSSNPQTMSLKRWRSAEQQVLAVLEARGWKVTDVSRQNLGYDVEGRTTENADAFVEVKSLDYPGQAFTLTSNEEAVARQKGTAYILVLVRQLNDYLEMAFIRDPARQLKLVRQCRQWVWECSSYPYQPERFTLNSNA